MGLTYVLKTASLTASTAYRFARRDPQHFTRQVSRRLGLPQNSILTKVVSHTPGGVQDRLSSLLGITDDTSSTQSHSEWKKGNISAALSLEKHPARLQRMKDDVALLTAVPSQVKPPTTARTTIESSRVLHYLTNSLPHTQSGYSLRSHSVLQAQQSVGLDVRAVTRLGYPITVGRFSPTDVDRVDSIEYHRLLPWSFPGDLVDRHADTVRHLIDAAEEWKPSCLHTTTDYRNGLVTEAAARQLGLPWVYEVRGDMAQTWLSRLPHDQQAQASRSEYYTLVRAQEGRVASRADHVVTLSHIVAEDLMTRGVDPSRITVIPNSVDDDLLSRSYNRAALRTELGLPDRPLVGSISAIVGYEGQQTLIESLLHLPEEWMVVLVGHGTALPQLKASAEELGLSDRVLCVGRQPSSEVWKWYAALDVFAVPRRDTLVCRHVTPMKPVAAQALGVPVVASDLPALREVTGEQAIYTTPEDAAALAEGILGARDLDTVAAKKVAARKTWSQAATRYADIYSKLNYSG